MEIFKNVGFDLEDIRLDLPITPLRVCGAVGPKQINHAFFVVPKIHESMFYGFGYGC